MIEEKLVRAVGFKRVVALTINGIIGAGIFAIPAAAAANLGTASPLAFLIAGFFTFVLVLCFAELSGLYDRTGGAYLYASEAFGSGTTSFLIGWMYFLARLTSSAALANAMVGFLGFFFPIQFPIREILIASLFLLLGGINYYGVRLSTGVISFLTVIKLLPLTLFIIAGLLFIRPEIFLDASMPSTDSLIKTVLPVMFAFTGFEIIAVPSAEIINPRKTLPLGILTGTAITICFYLLIQVVAVAAFPDLGKSERPLADASTVFLGRNGASLISAGAIFSTLGTLTSLILIAPRILYAMALQDQLPDFLTRIHSRFRTPHAAIIFFVLITTPFAVSATFLRLATLSAMARLVTYIGSAVALLVLRKRNEARQSFRAPGGPFVPVLAILLSLFFLAGATRKDWIAGGIALAIGLALHAFSSVLSRRKSQR